jgi:hypothetical protein
VHSTGLHSQRVYHRVDVQTRKVSTGRDEYSRYESASGCEKYLGRLLARVGTVTYPIATLSVVLPGSSSDYIYTEAAMGSVLILASVVIGENHGLRFGLRTGEKIDKLSHWIRTKCQDQLKQAENNQSRAEREGRDKGSES